MAKRFYNPSGRISETARFDHPTNDIREQNITSFWPIEAEAESFFEVPTELQVNTLESGEQSVSVTFWKRIKEEFKGRGVVLVDPNAKQPIHEDDNVALNDKDAKAKAERLWRNAMIELVNQHRALCNEIRANGLTPKKALGTVAHALKTLGIEDPANDTETVLQRKQDTSEVDALKEQLAQMRNDFQKILMQNQQPKAATTR